MRRGKLDLVKYNTSTRYSSPTNKGGKTPLRLPSVTNKPLSRGPNSHTVNFIGSKNGSFLLSCIPVFFSLLFLILLINVFLVSAPIAHESVNGGSTSYIDTVGLTWNHNIACENDLILIVGVATDSDVADQISGITYNGTGLTKIISVDSGDGQVIGDYWYLVNPDCGAEEAVVVTGSAHEDAAGISTVYSGVKAINASDVVTNTSIGSDFASIHVPTSTVNEIIVDMFALDVDPDASVDGDNQVERHEVDENDVQMSTSDGYDDDGTVIMNWSGGFDDEWVLIGVPLLPFEPPNIPVFTDNPDPVTVGKNITYNGTSTDPSDLNYKLSVCTTDSITAGYPGSCDGTSICNSSETSSSSKAQCDYNATVNDLGTFTVYAFSCNNKSVCSDSNSTSTTVNNPVAMNNQQAVPRFAMNDTNVNISANVTHIGGGIIDTVIARIYYPNGTSAANYSMTNTSGSIYWNASYTVDFGVAGTYDVTIFANDTNSVSNTAQANFSPILNVSNVTDIGIDGVFTDWQGVINITDISGDGYALVGGKSVSDADFTFYGGTNISMQEDFGVSLASGDVNNDGVADIVIGAPNANAPHNYSAGVVYVFFGNTTDTKKRVSLGEYDMIMYGNGQEDNAGSSVAVGDVNNDSIDDMIIGAVGAGYGGEAYIVYGGNYVSGTIMNLSTNANVTYEAVDSNENVGITVAVGDVNNDSIKDILISAVNTYGWNDEFYSAGEVYLVYGSPSLTDMNLSSANATFYGYNENDYVGYSLAVGDVNNDSIKDILITSPSAAYNGVSVGNIYVIFGKTSSLNDIILNQSNVTFYGINSYYKAGFYVASGDVNNDSVDDIVTSGLSGNGKIYVVYGNNSLTDRNLSFADVTYTGKKSGDDAGSSVSVEDINDDQVKDIIITAGDADGADNSLNESGEIYVIYGSTSLSDTTLDNANLTFYGVDEGDGEKTTMVDYYDFGIVTTINDINNDSINDIIIASSGADGYNNTYQDVGEAYIVYSPIADTNLSDANLTIYGGSNISRNDFFGTSVATGDFNIDGLQDYLIGASGSQGYSNRTGSAYIIFGTVDNDKQMDLNEYDVRFLGIDLYDYAGNIVASGDLNNDSIDDIIISAGGADGGGSNRGEIYIIYGRNFSSESIIFLSQANVTITGEEDGDGISDSLAVGDVNNDSIDDLVFGAMGADGVGGGASNRGEVYVFYGKDGILSDTTTASANATYSGISDTDQLGIAVAIGDVNNDSVNDIIMSSYRRFTSTGEVYVVYGNESLSDLEVDSDDVTYLGDGMSSRAGWALDSGDVNDDGIDDILIGAPGAKTGGSSNGKVYIVYGSSSLNDTNLTEANASFWGESYTDSAGDRVVSGDINNDTIEDIIIGSTGGLNLDSVAAGRAYVVYGSPTLNSINLTYANITFYGIDANDNFGSMIALDDIDGDGIRDFILSAFSSWGSSVSDGYRNAGKDRGEVHVILNQIPNYDITKVSIANNNTYLFAKIFVNSNISLTDSSRYYGLFISTNSSTGNQSTLGGGSLAFKYDYRLQVNGSSCAVYNSTNDNVGSCDYNNDSSQIELRVTFETLGLDGINTNVTYNVSFETGSNTNSYDFAPDSNSFIQFNAIGATGATSVTITDVSAEPHFVVNGTSINISANITTTAGASLSSKIARIRYPNGTSYVNITLNDNSGDIYWNDTFNPTFTPAGTYNYTIYATNDYGASSETGNYNYSPILNLTNVTDIAIDGTLTDWENVTNVTDLVGDSNEPGSANFTVIKASRNYFTCGVVENSAYCWGFGNNGRLGYGDNTSKNLPYPVNNITPNDLYPIDVSDEVSCGIATNGSAYCWGRGVNGVLGDNNTEVHVETSPVPVLGGHNFTKITVDSVGCAIAVNESAYCWGDGNSGRLGDGNVTLGNKAGVPRAVIGGHNFTEIDSGSGHTCGIVVNGSAYCWGDGFYGQLGDNDTEYHYNGTPRIVVGGYTFTKIAAGGYHTCGIVPNGSTYCWGLGNNGQLGDGNESDHEVGEPRPVNMTPNNFTEIAATGYSTCGILYNGSAYCWGRGEYGGLGDNDTSDHNESNPVPVKGGHNFTKITAGGSGMFSQHGCGIEVNGSAYCWGSGTSGQLGNNDNTSDQGIPVGVVFIYGGSGDSYDFKTVSLANNGTYLFAKIHVNGSIDFSTATKYYAMFISTNSSTGNQSTPGGGTLPFKYDFRAQVNGTACAVYNSTNDNVGSCDFDNDSSQIELRINLTLINTSTDSIINITFETGGSSYDFAPDTNSFLKYTVGGAPVVGWSNSSFDRCMNITIDNVGSTNLTNFPAYINLTYDNDMLSDFLDIRFYNEPCNDGGNEMDYEIENYTASTRAHIWTRIPTLLSTGSTISVYYKNNTAITSAENAEGVWDSNFRMVQHLQETGTRDRIDSTQYQSNGTPTSFNGSEATNNGRIAGADNFNGSQDINVGAIDFDYPISFECWMKANSNTSPGTRHLCLGRYYSGYSLGLWNQEYWRGSILNETDTQSVGVSGIKIDTWYHMAVTYNGSNASFYVDGVEQTPIVATGSLDRTYSDWVIGASGNGDNYLNGTADEVRISDSYRSSDWINQSYQIVENQDSIVTFGTEQSETLVVSLSFPSDNNHSVSLTDNITFNCSAVNDVALSNITLYTNLNSTSGWQVYQTNNVGGTSNSTTFTVNPSTLIGIYTLKDSNFVWDCLAYDTDGNSEWASANYTFSGWDLGTHTNTTRELSNSSTIELVLGKENKGNETATNLSNDLVFLYHFNNQSGYGENNTKVYDFSGNGNNGTVLDNNASNTDGDTPAQWDSSGKFGGGYVYDGVDDYIDTGVSINDSKNWTYALWVYFDHNGTDTADAIMNSGDNKVRMYYNEPWGGRIQTAYFNSTNQYNNGVIGTGTLERDTWYHIALRHNGTHLSVFYDGELNKNLSITDGIYDSSGNMAVGRANGNPMNGTMDEVGVWNRSLTDEEIRELYKRGSARKGEYTSKIFNAGSNSSWKNISWDEALPYDEELPNNKVSESVDGGVNMANNLVLYHLNNESAYGETDSKMYDFSGSGYNGSCTNCPTWNSSGKIRGAYDFDGVNDNITFSGSGPLAARANGTAAVWVKIKENGSNLKIWHSMEGRDRFIYTVGDTFYAAIYNGSRHRNISGGVVGNSWHHVVFTWDQTDANISLYVDGILVESDSVSWSTVGSESGTTIGGYKSSGTGLPELNYLNGSVDEFALWNVSLTPAEILRLYKRGALRLNISARSCDDADCDVETWTDFGSNANLTNISSISDNQYFQYKLTYESDDLNYTPQLNISSVTIQYGPGSGDSCSCPGAGSDWNVDMSDTCDIISNCDITTGYLNFTGTGNFTCNATINCTGMQYPSTDQTIYVENNCLITVN